MKVLGVLIGLFGIATAVLSQNYSAAIWAFNWTVLIAIYPTD